VKGGKEGKREKGTIKNGGRREEPNGEGWSKGVVEGLRGGYTRGGLRERKS